MAHAISPVVDILPAYLSKRRRSVTEDELQLPASEALDLKRRKPNALMDGSTSLESNAEGMVQQKKEAAVNQNRIRDAVDSQLSLEILLKHNELRLINQELAKCRVALEQLRRCHLISYTTSQDTQESMANITSGTGPAVWPRGNVPQWAPPYGVTDGPYTRHYAKWLIPDPAFDGVQVDWSRSMEGSRGSMSISEGRSTRYGFADNGTPASKVRSQRGSTGQKLQALSSGYPQAKEKAGPCVLKRADGQMVKLVCIDCQRENFSSTQGFINHCRIAHRRDFKSHEEAAVASGQPIEIDEIGGIVGEERTPAVATGLVHPLIRSAPTDKEAYMALLSRIDASMALYKQGKLPGVTSIPTSSNSTLSKDNISNPTGLVTPIKSFVPSTDTPHLSALMRSRGFSGNLGEIVGEAKIRIDLEEFSSHGEESEDSEKRPDVPRRHHGGIDGSDSPRPVMRMPARAAMAPAMGRPGSSKGVDGSNVRKPGLSGISPRLSYATPVINTTATASHNNMENRHVNSYHHDDHTDVDVDMFDGPSIVDLSPNTVASNNAPSLVSDDGEYDEGDEDAESATSADEDEGSDVAEIDIEDGEGVEKVVPRTMLRSRGGNGEGMRLRKEEKHVTFVSPVKDNAKERRSRK